MSAAGPGSTSRCSTGNPARRFYERIGMTHESEWLTYRMGQDAIAALAHREAPQRG